MKINVSTQDELMIKQVLKKMLMKSDGRLFIIDEVSFEDLDVTKTTGFLKKTSTTIKKRFITGAKIYSYHTEGKFLGTLTDDSAEQFLRYYNFYELRKQYEDFKEMLKAFGFEIQPIVEEQSPVAESWKDQMNTALDQGMNLEAIRLYKINTGCTLEESRTYILALIDKRKTPKSLVNNEDWFNL